MAIAQTELRSSTPERILHAAFEAIRDFGLPRVTVEDVAQRAGLSRQTVYRYFPSKDELIIALVSREEEKLLDGVRAVFAAHEDLEQALKESMLFVLRYAREHPLLDPDLRLGDLGADEREGEVQPSPSHGGLDELAVPPQ